MKKYLIIIFIALIALPFISCTSEDKAMVEEAVEEGMSTPDRIKTISDLSQLRNAVKMYYMDDNHMRYPDNLDMLKLNLYYSTDEYEYDNTNGNVSSKHYKNL